MHDAGRMNILQAAEDLVEEILDELLFERSRGKESVEVSPKQLRHEVDVFEGGNENVAQGDDVLVSKMLEQLQFSVRSLG